MIRAVLDANVIVSAFLRPSGPPGLVVAALLRRSVQVVFSPPILEEIHRCLRYPKVRKHIAASDEEIETWVAALAVLADVVPGTTRIRAIAADPDHDTYLAAALEGRAEYVVSSDHHLLDLGEVQGVAIVTPREFLDRLGKTV